MSGYNRITCDCHVVVLIIRYDEYEGTDNRFSQSGVHTHRQYLEKYPVKKLCLQIETIKKPRHMWNLIWDKDAN